MENHGTAKSNPSLPHLGACMCVIRTLKWPMESNQLKMLQGEGGTHHTFEVSTAHCNYYNHFCSLTQKEPPHLVTKNYQYPGGCCVLCVKEESNVTCTSTWSENIQIRVWNLLLSDSSGCHHAVLLCHTCTGISMLSYCPHNQNIAQNPHADEVLPNNWINHRQRWTSHLTLSASKLTQNYNNPPSQKLTLCIPHVSPSLHQSGNTTSNNQ